MKIRGLQTSAQSNFSSSSAVKRIQNTLHEQHRGKFDLSAVNDFKLNGFAMKSKAVVHAS